MKPIHSLLLASTALIAISASAAPGAATEVPLVVAQAPGVDVGAAARERQKKDEEEQKKQAPSLQPPKPAQAPAAKQAPGQAQPAQTPAAPMKPAQAPAAKPAQAPAAQAKPEPQKPAPAAQAKPEPQKPAPAPAAQNPARQPTAQQDGRDRREQRRDDRSQQPAAAQPKDAPNKPAQNAAPAQPARPAPPATAAQPTPPSATAQPTPPAAAAQPTPPAAAAQPTKPRDSADFIRRGNDGPSRGMDDVRRERKETREGNRTIIREGDRTIVREGNRTIIRHNEAERFAVGARDIRVDRRGNETFTVIARPNGISIVNVTDANGRLIRRVRRDRDGHEIVILNNRFAGARGDVFVDVRPPRRGPREHYIIDAGRADAEEIYGVFMAPPVETIERRYTIDQVRYSEPLRQHMPRVDLDINFETGSWQLTPDQVERLSVIARGLIRAIERNPREVFLIEGHTDKVGSDQDNLSLSDRRAEAVAVALTEQFQVPPENLLTQGYGEEYPKVATEGDERANRRVAVRRITPLIAQAEGEGKR